MDPNKKPEEAAATSEMYKGKMAASSEEEPAPTSEMDISEEKESSEEEPAPTSEMDKGKRPASSSEEEPALRHSDLVTDAAETAARLIAEAEFKEKVAELAAMHMQIAQNLAEESQIRLKVLTELRDKTLRGEKVKLNWPPPKDGDDKDK